MYIAIHPTVHHQFMNVMTTNYTELKQAQFKLEL